MRGCDDQDFTNSREHQSGDWVINHWLVVDRQKLLAHTTGDWPKSRASATCEDDTLHWISLKGKVRLS
jgi:hypothetical protein